MSALQRDKLVQSNRHLDRRGQSLTQLTDAFSDILTGERADQRRSMFLAEASMAAAALVATAEGDVSFAERALIDQAIGALADRGAIDAHEAMSLFNDYVDGIRANTSQGRRPALNALTGIEGAADAATIVLRIADAVATADGAASAAEIAVIQEISAALNAAAQ